MFQGRVEGGSSAISRMLAPKVGATTGGKVLEQMPVLWLVEILQI